MHSKTLERTSGLLMHGWMGGLTIPYLHSHKFDWWRWNWSEPIICPDDDDSLTSCSTIRNNVFSCVLGISATESLKLTTGYYKPMQGWSKVNIQWSQLNTQGWEWENTYLQWNAYIDVIINQNVASLMKMRLSKVSSDNNVFPSEYQQILVIHFRVKVRKTDWGHHLRPFLAVDKA